MSILAGGFIRKNGSKCRGACTLNDIGIDLLIPKRGRLLQVPPLGAFRAKEPDYAAMFMPMF